MAHRSLMLATVTDFFILCISFYFTLLFPLPIVRFLYSGETEVNAASPRVIQGQSDNSLSQQGQLQAKAIAWRLRREKIHHVYSSDLGRAKEVRN